MVINLGIQGREENPIPSPTPYKTLTDRLRQSNTINICTAYNKIQTYSSVYELQVYTGIFNHNIGANLQSQSVYCHNTYFHRHCFIIRYYVAEFQNVIRRPAFISDGLYNYSHGKTSQTANDSCPIIFTRTEYTHLEEICILTNHKVYIIG